MPARNTSGDDDARPVAAEEPTIVYAHLAEHAALVQEAAGFPGAALNLSPDDARGVLEREAQRLGVDLADLAADILERRRSVPSVSERGPLRPSRGSASSGPPADTRQMSGTATPRIGHHSWFVRYISTREGWVPETIRGDVEERTATGWVLRVGTELRELPESEWSPFAPLSPADDASTPIPVNDPHSERLALRDDS